MNMKKFIRLYAKNLYETLSEQGFSIEGCGLQCDCCPLQKACEKSAEAGEDCTCGEFIQKQLTDGKNFRAK